MTKYVWWGPFGPYPYDETSDIGGAALYDGGVTTPKKGGLVTSGALLVGGGVVQDGWKATAKTIAGDAIAIDESICHVQLTGQGDVADDLDSITGAVEGQRLVLRGKTGIGYAVTVKDSATLHLEGDFGIDSEYDTILLLNIGSDHWIELAHANNA